MPKPGSRSSSPYSKRRWTPDDAKSALAAFDASGLTLSAFAIDAGLDPQRLARWRRRLAVSVEAPVFEEILLRESAAPAGERAAPTSAHQRFEIVLVSGRVVRVPESFDTGTLRRLLEVVDEVRAC